MKRINGGKLTLFATLLVSALYFTIPLASAAAFSLKQPLKGNYGLDNYIWFFKAPDFGHYLLVSLSLSLGASAVMLVLLVPTVIWLNLGGKKIRPIAEFLSLLPLVIPVVALAIGAQNSLPEFAQTNEGVLSFMYAVLAMPYAYHTLDIGLRAVPLQIISEAARGLGANWFRTIFQVITPIVRNTVLGSLFMTLALSLGEFTLTSLLHWDTFPTWVTQLSQSNILGAIALSVFSLVAVFVVLVLVGLLVKPTPSQTVVEKD